MARFLRTVLVGVTGAALLVSLGVAGIPRVSNGCANDADESGCVCCPHTDHAGRDCCAPRGPSQGSTERDGCGSCPAGGCCGCCATVVTAVAVGAGSAPVESALALSVSQAVERFASRDDEPLLPPPIA
jgi:hypothetical protein